MAVVTRSRAKQFAVFAFAPGRASARKAVAHGVGNKVIEKIKRAVAGDDDVFHRSIKDFSEKAAAFRNAIHNAVVADIETVFAFKIFCFGIYKVEHGQRKGKLFRTGFATGNIKF